MSYTFQVTFDCANPERLAKFWSDALGYVLQPPPEGFNSWDEFAEANQIPKEKRGDIAAIIDPAGSGPRVLFLRVPEGKTVKNRVHLDVNVSTSGSDPEAGKTEVRSVAERLTELGATRLNEVDGRNDFWIVMQDPEGNEFCIQ